MKLSLHSAWRLLALASIHLAGVALAETPADARRPNIVVIMVDDVGWGDLGCYGATKIKTPNLDALARDGMWFTDAHSTAAVCTSTRYALLTGEYSWRRRASGLDRSVADGDSPLLISVGTTTLPGIMKKAGYRTAGETRNLAQEQPEVLKRLTDLLETTRAAKSTRPASS